MKSDKKILVVLLILLGNASDTNAAFFRGLNCATSLFSGAIASNLSMMRLQAEERTCKKTKEKHRKKEDQLRPEDIKTKEDFKKFAQQACENMGCKWVCDTFTILHPKFDSWLQYEKDYDHNDTIEGYTYMVYTSTVDENQNLVSCELNQDADNHIVIKLDTTDIQFEHVLRHELQHGACLHAVIKAAQEKILNTIMADREETCLYNGKFVPVLKIDMSPYREEILLGLCRKDENEADLRACLDKYNKIHDRTFFAALSYDYNVTKNSFYEYLNRESISPFSTSIKLECLARSREHQSPVSRIAMLVDLYDLSQKYDGVVPESEIVKLKNRLRHDYEDTVKNTVNLFARAEEILEDLKRKVEK